LFNKNNNTVIFSRYFIIGQINLQQHTRLDVILGSTKFTNTGFVFVGKTKTTKNSLVTAIAEL
jgi:hypothetical protein